MEFQEDSDNPLYAEADENFTIDNPDGNLNEPVPEVKEGDSLLVDMVRQYPLLYDKSVPGYKNTTLRGNCWRVIAHVMEKEPNYCAKRWGQLRESFSRERKKRAEESRSGSGQSSRKGFPLYGDMSFLEAHIQTRRTFTNVRSISNSLRSTMVPGYLSSTAMIPVRPLRIPLSCNLISTRPESVTSLSPPPEISERESANTRASSPGPFAEMPLTSVLRPTLSPTLPLGLLTPAPSSSAPTPSPSPDAFTSSPHNSSTFLYSGPSPSYPYSPSPSYYPRATLSAIPYTSSVPRPSSSPVLNSNMNSQHRRNDSFSSRSSTSQPLTCLRIPSSSQNNVIGENLPLSPPHRFSQPTGCFNKDLVKTKKLDPVETAFLGVSAALQNHLSNSVCNETEKKSAPSDDAFANLIAAELKHLDEPIRAAKKIRLMQVLYETE